MSRRKKQQEPTIVAAENAANEPTANDTSSETPRETLLENADARIVAADEAGKPEQFYCFATGCPGYEYRADVKAHPVATCGSIVNCVHLHKTNPPPAAETTPSIVETEAPISETIRAVAQPEPAEIEPPPLTTPANDIPEPEPAPEVPDENPPTADGLQVPEIGSLWLISGAIAPELVEVLGLVGVAIPTAETQVGVVTYLGDTVEIATSEEGIGNGGFFKIADFNNGRLLPYFGQVPRWIVEHLTIAARSQLTLDRILDRDFDAVDFSNVPDMPGLTDEPLDGAIEPPAEPGATFDDRNADYAGVFASKIVAFADEIGVSPVHACRTVDSVLDLVVQIVTFQGELRTSPMVAALRDRVLEESSKSTGIVAALLSVLRPSMSQLFERTAADYWVQRSTELDKWATEVETKIAGFYGEIRQMREQLEDVSKYGKQDASAAALKVTESELKKAGEQVDGALDRLFALESWQGKIQKEIGNFARSRKLQKHDPKSAAERGREFRKREAELRVEKERNLAKLRADKKKAEAIERGEKRGRGRPPKVAEQPAKRGRGRPRKHPLPVGDQAARNAVSAPAKRGRGRPPKVAPSPAKRGRGRPPKTAIPQPKGGGSSVVASFMGKHKDDAVRKLLEKISPYKWPDFAKQCKSGLPDMTALKWGPAQMSTFAKWYYGRQLGIK